MCNLNPSIYISIYIYIYITVVRNHTKQHAHHFLKKKKTTCSPILAWTSGSPHKYSSSITKINVVSRVPYELIQGQIGNKGSSYMRTNRVVDNSSMNTQ